MYRLQFFLSLAKFQTRMLVLNTNIIRRDDERGKRIGQMCQAIQDSVLLFLCCGIAYSFQFSPLFSFTPCLYMSMEEREGEHKKNLYAQKTQVMIKI